jgi:hypothetical protein
MTDLIPSELYTLDDETFTPEALQAAIPELMKDERTFLFGMIEDSKIIGLYWARINDLSNRLVVFGMSLLKEFQNTGGRNIEIFKELSRQLVNEHKLSSTVELYSNHPKIAERYGLKRARCTIMEYESEDSHGQRGFSESNPGIDS